MCQVRFNRALTAFVSLGQLLCGSNSEPEERERICVQWLSGFDLPKRTDHLGKVKEE